MPSVIDTAGGSECQACKGGGLVFPPRGVPFGDRLLIAPNAQPVRALPLPCSFCAAGALEAMLWEVLELKGIRGAEIEFRAFRKAKG